MVILLDGEDTETGEVCGSRGDGVAGELFEGEFIDFGVWESAVDGGDMVGSEVGEDTHREGLDSLVDCGLGLSLLLSDEGNAVRGGEIWVDVCHGMILRVDCDGFWRVGQWKRVEEW